MRHEFSYAEYDENSQETPFSRTARLNIDLPFDKCEYEFVGSCNGLICMDSWFSEIYEPTYIFNPITREYIILPTSEGDYWWTGFGYILSTNEYKVVGVYNTRGDSNVTSVYVYTLGSSTGWRNVGTVDMDMQICRRSVGAFANGALHWEDDSGNIFAFHLTDEKFSKRPSLPCLTEADFSNYPKNKDNYNDLSWSKEFSFHTYMSPPFGYTKSGRLLCYKRHKIYGYDQKESSARMDVDFGESIDGAIAHKNTLVSLKALGEKDAKTMESGERA
ncbi:F-box protein At3g07870-like [Papaver somniferum]|uniref:F-box protein At3g07870-like n=1 Tax=Papaver somniferum TaxID=3469 RepID=UPI000E6FC001|nr:F-box protein At3g07870-like [Papaver somniferum]